ncbi:Expansin-YoaJ [Erwinia tracheiphila]|uniref:expansin EXLX1 family cellulose-binding protein n=1 Tax=Erwinia tracheiphila TaxID=65700 RepID=UPI00039E9C66|nr:expansin EXLX1 family cellulose-binding protein [Erwinia tracheiphila]UIA88020.1 Expansin-YoaJ [Erwinia tracheiphila]UIA96612.1 Expansin-YoaJ [Erwinia tracheiphila]
MSFRLLTKITPICAVLTLGLTLSSTLAQAADAIWSKNKVCRGYATETGSGYSGGALLLDPIPAGMNIAALSPYQLNSGGIRASLAGAWLQVTGPAGSINVYVTDLYPEGKSCALDLSPGAFKKISGIPPGWVDNIHWKVIPGPYEGPVLYRIKEGSTIYWAAIQVRRTRYPVVSMDYYELGHWIRANKTDYNHFILNKTGPGNIKIRYRDIYGHQLSDYIPDAVLNKESSKVKIIPGRVQFPL